MQIPLIHAMDEGCNHTDAASMQGWICHARIFFPHCLADEDIDYEVNEILWLSNFFMLSTYSYRFFLSFMIVQIGFQSHVYIVKYYDDQ